MSQNNFEELKEQNADDIKNVKNEEIKSSSNFSSIEEELEYLRNEVKKSREQKIYTGEQFEEDDIIRKEIREYHENTGRDLLHESYKQPENQTQEIVLNLIPENHDKNMEEYWTLMNQNGIYNTLNILKNNGNPHLEDDFHRFLVEYIKAGLSVKKLKEQDPVDKSIKQTLYQVSLPDFKQKDGSQKPLKELLSVMEQFYMGMTSISESGKKFGDSKNNMTIELSIASGSDEFIFYVSVPNDKTDLFEKHILSVFPEAKIEIEHNDYNIFNEDGVSIGSIAEFVKQDIYPIKTYEVFDTDPINVILNNLSKIQKDGEGACLQVVFNNVGDYYHKLYKDALDDVLKGENLKKTINIQHTIWGQFKKVAGEIGKEVVDGALSSSDKKDEHKEKFIDQIAVEQIKAKIATPIIETNIRLMVSAKERIRAEAILSDLESSFNQFNNSLGNSFKWNRVKDSKLKDLFYKFTFRLFDRDQVLPISIKEIATVMHFPVATQSNFSPQLKQATAATAPVPLDIPKKGEGVFIGKNIHRNIEQDVYMTPEDRLRHMYVIGQTGTGKSTILRNLIVQDIINGDGVCFIDPHGSDVQDILSKIPKERYDDVIYFDPGYTDRPFALNMLEYDHSNPEQKTFVVNELFSIFQKLYSAGSPESMGPMFEQYFRNATMLVMDDPDSGCTLLDISRVMAVKSFRDMKVARCKNPIVKQFWTEIAEKTSGESGLANMIPYITSKFDVFSSNDIMRPIIAQEKSSFNMRDIMDNKKILLVNLAKGRLGDINSNLIGLILVGKILMAALSRVDSFGKDMSQFYLYIDEFHNITTPSISTILSEARKYKLSLTMANQFLAQLDEKIKASVFGNVGNMVVYRSGVEEAEFLQKQFEPVFTAKDIMNIDNLNAYIKMLSHGKPTKPFNIRVDHMPKGNMDIVESLKELSYLKYGRDKDSIKEEIDNKFAADKPKPKPAPDLSSFGL